MSTLIDIERLPGTVEELRPLLAAPHWRWRDAPFPHVVAHDVFNRDVYEQITGDFHRLLEQQQIVGYNTQHDFYGSSLQRGQCGALELFLSPAWYELFAGLFQVTGPRYLTAGVHRHRPGSRDGFPHNDIFPELLSARRADGEVRAFGGRVEGKSVRAVAILFYLNNGRWAPGAGGETALYRDWKDPVDEPVASVPPRDNTLFAFGCNPHSYHSFRANRKRRDTVISFVYRSLADYRQLWGDEGVQQYKQYADFRRHDA